MENRLKALDPASKKSRGHRLRLREKFLRGGLDSFLDYEIIELLLSLGTWRRALTTSRKSGGSVRTTFSVSDSSRRSPDASSVKGC
jgi:DNA repair protein RadC